MMEFCLQRKGEKRACDNGSQITATRWSNGQPQGVGVLVPVGVSRDRFAVCWQIDPLTGLGCLSRDDGERYRGAFWAGLRHGHGEWWSSDGHHYVGAFNMDMFHGHGQYTSADGSRYVGEFERHEFHGQGVMTYSDGRPTRSGRWIHDEMASRGRGGGA
jgi:hypothetical protein